MLVGGGVLSDRLPRNLVIAGASLVQGAAQAATAAFVLTGSGSILAIVVAAGASTASAAGSSSRPRSGSCRRPSAPARLQQANALQGLSAQPDRHPRPGDRRRARRRREPGLGARPRCAQLHRLRGASLPDQDRPPGVRATSARASSTSSARAGRSSPRATWLWASVILFGIGNLGFCAWIVLGPVIAKRGSRRCRRLGRRSSRSAGVGAIVGSMIALRIAPERPLVACTICAIPLAGQVARPRRGAVRVAALGCGVLRRRRPRRAPNALVHRSSSGRSPRQCSPRQLLRRARLVRADAARLRHRRPGLAMRSASPRRCGSRSL